VRGPLFPSLHPLFEQFAVAIAGLSDAIAERAVTLGARAYGTARHVANASRLPEYPQETVRDLEHIRLLADRFDAYLQGLHQARRIAEEGDDGDTADLLTQAISDFEKNAWFLRATGDA